MIALQRFALHPLTKIVFFGLLVLLANFFLVTIPLNSIIRRVVVSIAVITITALFLKMENRSFQSIGISLKFKSLKYLVVGLLGGVGMLTVTALVTKGSVGFSWQLNSDASFSGIFILLNFYFWSALIEELVFRGYGFQRLAEYKGKWVALISIGLLFGLYHINAGMAMSEILVTMLSTGVGHIFFGLALLKMKSLALPLGLHMGWNAAQELIPRHPSINSKNSMLHVVQTGSVEYNPLLFTVPYLVVIGIGCAYFLFYKKTGETSV